MVMLLVRASVAHHYDILGQFQVHPGAGLFCFQQHHPMPSKLFKKTL